MDRPAGRRPQCARCARPLAACLCACVRAVDNEVEVLVLQHPQEQGQAKGTATLLTLSLRRCQLRVGEQFEPGLLQQLLDAPSAEGQPMQALLLYPGATPTEAATALPPSRLRLVVLDGSWRKSRKMLALNPALRALPRLSLVQPPPSRYAVRRAESAEQRSTLEATVLALQQLEARPQRYDTLWEGLDHFMAQLSSRMPTEHLRPTA